MRRRVHRIWHGVESGREWLSKRFAWLGAWADVVGLVLVAIVGALALAHSAHFPSSMAWSKGHPLPPAQIAAGVLLVMTQIVVVVRARRGRRNTELEDACRHVAGYIDEHCPEVHLREVGVHIWTVAGPPFARYLRRSGSFLLGGQRARSGIRWMKGKGVVGFAWAERMKKIKDIEEIRARARSEEQFDALADEEKLGLTWAEFQQTPNYQTVCANPLYRRDNSSSRPDVRGVLAIDFLGRGHCQELDKATDDPRFASVVGVCESALES